MKKIILVLCVLVSILFLTYKKEWEKKAMSDMWYDSHPVEVQQLLDQCKAKNEQTEVCGAVISYRERHLPVNEVVELVNKGILYTNQGNYQEAMKVYLKAAANGNFDAMNNIGYLYATGKGVNKDEEKAFEWYLKAAKRGLPLSMYVVGVRYYYGQGVTKDEEQAKQWLTKAANQGSSEARDFLEKIK